MKRNPQRAVSWLWMVCAVGALLHCAAAGAQPVPVFGTQEMLNTDGNSDGQLTDMFPRTASDGDGRWITVWQRHDAAASNPESDIYYAASDDGGATWNVPQMLHDTASIDGDRADERPSIATDAQATGWRHGHLSSISAGWQAQTWICSMCDPRTTAAPGARPLF